MNFSTADFVTVNEILSDVLLLVQDDGYRLLSKGWYTSQAQQALEELSFDTFFSDKNPILIEIPETLKIDIPKGTFNIRQLYVTNGNTCNIGESHNVYHKRNFIAGSESGYLARDKYNNGRDPFYRGRNFHESTPAKGDELRGQPANVYYYGVHNGVINLSSNCRSFKNLFIVANGIATEIGDTPLVPNFLRQAVKSYVSVKALKVKVSDSVGTNLFGHWSAQLANEKNEMENMVNGTWIKAERRTKSFDSKHREDLNEYFAKLNY
jgi:hypothetical protein